MNMFYNPLTDGSVQPEETDFSQVDTITEEPTTYTHPDEVPAAVVRKWAKENGIPVSDRARIARSVRDKYNYAHGLTDVDPDVEPEDPYLV